MQFSEIFCISFTLNYVDYIYSLLLASAYFLYTPWPYGSAKFYRVPQKEYTYF